MAEDNGGFMWFLAGLGLGALVGVLYAPRSGSETREVLREKAEEGREFVKSRSRQVRDQAGDWVERGKDVVGQQRETFKSAFEAGRQAYREATAESSTGKSKG